jgi:hypothetical protein
MALVDAGRSSYGRFVLRFVEMQILMLIGATVCYVLGRLVPASSGLATIYHPGTVLFTVGDVIFLSGPVAGWLILRGHGWRYGVEMAVAMFAPVAVIVAAGELAGSEYRVWLVTAMYPAMCLGMVADMAFRWDHYTQAGQGGRWSIFNRGKWLRR